MSTCKSFIPFNFANDEKIFPERKSEYGTMYVEAEDKETMTTIRNVTFVRVNAVLGIIYSSKSGRTRLRWRNVKGDLGKLIGAASSNSLVNLYASGTLDRSYAFQAERM